MMDALRLRRPGADPILSLPRGEPPTAGQGDVMAKLARTMQTALADTAPLRLRAASLYYRGGRTQGEIAGDLGVSRSTVIQLLDEARRRGEVQIWIEPTPGELKDLAGALQDLYGLREVLISPGEGTPEETAVDVGAVLGRFLSTTVRDDMVIGAGWGRTLAAALTTFRPQRRSGVEVVSLLGGLLEPDTLNPIDFSWQIAAALGAECSLFLAPLIVDSPETKRRLVDACGLGALVEMAARLDLAVVSCGDIGPEGSSFSRQFLPPEDLDGLLAAGAICDTLCQFLDAEGKTIDHPIRHRVMSVDLDIVANAPHVVLASGGRVRAPAIRAAILRTRCKTLVTDEAAARALLMLQAP